MGAPGGGTRTGEAMSGEVGVGDRLCVLGTSKRSRPPPGSAVAGAVEAFAVDVRGEHHDYEEPGLTLGGRRPSSGQGSH